MKTSTNKFLNYVWDTFKNMQISNEGNIEQIKKLIVYTKVIN